MNARQFGNSSDVAFVLVHGSWHGAWCWSLVEQALNAAGHMTVAIDLPGHGLNAVMPESFLQRPLDPARFAEEPSPLAGIGIDAYADAVIAGADRALAAGARQICAVGHSAGGVPISFAAAKAPEKFAGLVYVAAGAPTPGKPSGAYLQAEVETNNSKIGAVLLADPEKVGALRMDPRSADPGYLARAREVLAADVDEALLASVMHLLTPDAPAAIHGELAQFDDRFAELERTFIRCTNDLIVVPSMCEAIVADMNSAWPQSKTRLVDIESSHEVMFSRPKELARLILDAL